MANGSPILQQPNSAPNPSILEENTQLPIYSSSYYHRLARPRGPLQSPASWALAHLYLGDPWLRGGVMTLGGMADVPPRCAQMLPRLHKQGLDVRQPELSAQLLEHIHRQIHWALGLCL